MVGGEGGPGTAPARLTGAMRAAYEAAADDWDGGPGQMYSELARALVAHASVPVAGLRVLDLGAGTGAAGAAAVAAGADQVVAADIAAGMLRRCAATLHPVAADAAALPFRDQSFDLAVAAFCLSHLGSMAGCLAEARRVCGAIAASAFAPGWTHPAKRAVDDVLTAFGYRAPDWYQTFKEQTEPQAADSALLQEQAAAAGFAGVRVRTVTVATGLTTSAQLASWRLGMAHIVPFTASLSLARRAALQHAAEAGVQAAVQGIGDGPLEVSMLVLTGGPDS
jgi:ubiquinone/menaquinone biosynthesis C-methylase UbiE